jgi:hypothetical protein
MGGWEIGIPSVPLLSSEGLIRILVQEKLIFSVAF